ncbi:transglutaminase-like cysteine peptidase [Litorilituus lipolyticus]|uniref:Sulfate adenylyltransferase n=1 Tax=Litorilituus lipolyticus TaxID=2491017 RepID=A0A502KVK2_9GAMM|nr:transglutaminase-like cysteine peptidase [Litorilituus lipolyticus]TPH14265.1 sulfate adenylyltransferase [Litorilituus lipolyticus]
MAKDTSNFIILLLICVLWPLLAVNQQKLLDWDALEIKLINQYGENSGKRLRAWQAVLNDQTLSTELDKLKRVNRFFNLLNFVDDVPLWGKKDYWATPLEFIGANAGDCEDFSIAKYFSLLSMGISEEKMRITYVKALTLNQYHMVLAYYPTPNAVPLILDNINGKILPADQRKDLIPVYSFNGENLWLSKAKGQGKLAGKSSRLKSWNKLRERFNNTELGKPLYIP